MRYEKLIREMEGDNISGAATLTERGAEALPSWLKRARFSAESGWAVGPTLVCRVEPTTSLYKAALGYVKCSEQIKGRRNPKLK